MAPPLIYLTFFYKTKLNRLRDEGINNSGLSTNITIDLLTWLLFIFSFYKIFYNI